MKYHKRNKEFMIPFFWAVALCRCVSASRRCEGTYPPRASSPLDLQDEGVIYSGVRRSLTSQKIGPFDYNAAKTSEIAIKCKDKRRIFFETRTVPLRLKILNKGL